MRKLVRNLYHAYLKSILKRLRVAKKRGAVAKSVGSGGVHHIFL